MGLLITMGSISIGSCLIQKVLVEFGEAGKAQYVGIVATSTLIGFVIVAAKTVFDNVAKLGN